MLKLLASNFENISNVPLPDDYIPNSPLPRVSQHAILNNYGKILFQWLWTSYCEW